MEPTATPTTPPIWRAKTNMPMARPTSSSGTEACIGIVRAGYSIPSPAPARIWKPVRWWALEVDRKREMTPKPAMVRVQALQTLQRYLRRYSIVKATRMAKGITVKQMGKTSMAAVNGRCWMEDSK